MLSTSSSDPNGYAGECDFAVVTLVPEILTEIRTRQAYLNQLRTLDEAAFSLKFWDYKATYLSRFEFEQFFNPSDTAEQNLGDQGYHLFKFKKDPIATASASGQSTEMDTLVVYNDSFYWTCTPKHTDIEVATAHLTIDQLQSMLV